MPALTPTDVHALISQADAALWAGLPRVSGLLHASFTERVELWHSVAVAWQQDWTTIAERGEPSITEWLNLGIRIATQGQSIATDMGDATTIAVLGRIVGQLPASFLQVTRDAASSVVNAAGDVVADAEKQAARGVKAAAWDVGIVVLVLGGALAAVLYLASKSGARINAGPIGIG